MIKEKSILKEMIEQLDLPDSIEKKVRERYKSIGEWFKRDDSTLKDVDIFVQGSFGQGTTIKPLEDGEEYDLDMSCKVNIKSFKTKYTQKELMKMVKGELELYRKYAGIHSEIEEKQRCLRLYYKDEVPFHLDFVPSVPMEEDGRYHTAIYKHYEGDEKFASNLTKYAVNIPDKEKENYNTLSQDWHISNQQGYLLWFQRKIAKNNASIIKSSIEEIPVYEQKTVLQRCIQLLKRHRDKMFNGEKIKDCKPSSIIITTLAARAYNGEQNIEQAILNILNTMSSYINTTVPRISNPVKPEEDFSDRWDNPKNVEYELEDNFYRWLQQAKIDFIQLSNDKNTKKVRSLLQHGFGLEFSENKLKSEYGYKASIFPKREVETPIVKPWMKL